MMFQAGKKIYADIAEEVPDFRLLKCLTLSGDECKSHYSQKTENKT